MEFVVPVTMEFVVPVTMEFVVPEPVEGARNYLFISATLPPEIPYSS